MAVEAKEIVGFQLLRDECLRGAFQDVNSDRNLLGSLLSSSLNSVCLDSNGLSSHYVTQKAVSNLLPSLSSNFSIEMWYRPQFNVSQDRFIVSLALPSLSRFGSCFSNLEILESRSSNSALSKFAVQACNGKTSTSMEFPEINLNARASGSKINHITMSFSYSSFLIGSTTMQEMLVQFIVNGVSRDAQRYVSVNSLKPADWNANSVLHTFPEGLIPGAESSLYKLYIYDKALSTQEAMVLYRKGIANSKPTIKNATVSILENGISNDTSSDPAYYIIPVPSIDLPVITLPVFDLDDDPSSPNYSSARGKAQVFIRQAPVVGDLYYLNGSRMPSMALASTPVPFNSTTRSYAVRYRPSWDVFSRDDATPLVVIRFAAVDGVTGEAAGWDGLLQVIVKKVVKPPKLDNAATYAVKSRALFQGFNLKGVADDGNATKTIFVSALPQFGLLYQIAIAGGLKTTLSVSQLGLPIDLNAYRIGYIYTGVEALLTVSSSNITTDYFSYGVIDSTGRRSLTSQTFLKVNSALSINAQSVWTVRESTSSSFSVHGIDASDSPRPLQYLIDRAPMYGTANLTTDNMKVVYKGQSDFFTFPNTTWDSQTVRNHIPFDYVYLTAFTSDGAVSVPTKQIIQVINVNDPTSITIDGAQSFITHAFGGVTGDTLDYSEVTFQGILVSDPDLGVDPVHVEIYTSNAGRITLNRTALRLHSDYVDFSSISLCQRLTAWTCSGYAVDSDYMSFVTSPLILQELLNGMTYINTVPDITDAVTIKVSDGEGGSSCLTNSQHEPGSFRSGCFQASLTLEIEVLGFYGKGRFANSTSSTATFLNLQYTMLALVILIFLLCFRCFCVSRKRNTKSENAKDDGDIENQLPKKGGRNLSPSVVNVNIVQHTPPHSPPHGPQDSVSLLDSNDVSVSISRYDSERRELMKHQQRHSSKKFRQSPAGSRLSRRLHREGSSTKTKELNEVKVHLYSSLPVSTPDRKSGGTSSEGSPKKKSKPHMTKKSSEEWTAHRHSCGKTYYYNHKTKKSTWKKPENLS